MSLRPNTPAGVAAQHQLWPGAAIVAAIAVGAASTVSLYRPPSPATALSAARLTITPAPSEALTVNHVNHDLAISEDGSHVAWIGHNGSQLFVRNLNQLAPTGIAPTDSGNVGTAQNVFFSPDGQSLGFFDAESALRTVPISGGPSVRIAKAEGIPLGATWGPDEAIVFATNSPTTGLQAVMATGGAVTTLTRPNRERGEIGHHWPHFLPGGRILFTVTSLMGSAQENQLAVLDPATGTQTTILRSASDGRYLPGGHLLFHRGDGQLWGVGFDLEGLETVGQPIQVLPQVVTSSAGAGDFDVAQNGTLVYVAEGSQGVRRSLVWKSVSEATPATLIVVQNVFEELKP